MVWVLVFVVVLIMVWVVLIDWLWLLLSLVMINGDVFDLILWLFMNIGVIVDFIMIFILLYKYDILVLYVFSF